MKCAERVVRFPVIRRRQVLRSGLGAAAAAALAGRSDAGVWHAREIVHLLPAASHDRFLIKCSLRAPLARAPVLGVGPRRFEGVRSDSSGLYWQFHATGLTPATGYRVSISGPDGRLLCDPWPLRTFPAPDQRAERLRILTFTCAGGYPFPAARGQPEAFRPLEIRHALLERALSFAPDVAVANGDHIYWDQRTWFESANPAMREAAQAIASRFGRLDPSLPALGSENEAIIKRLAAPQIAGVYATRMRSTPMFFVGDDHDYFENDEANERYVTFPPEAPNIAWARAVQHLFYPEFLPDPHRPLHLPGSCASDRADGLSESFGTLRYGDLVECPIYDCGRFLSLKDRHAGLVPPQVEAWLIARTAASDARQAIHMPSHPFGWSAGKWREWYPDAVASNAGSGGPSGGYAAAGGHARLDPATHKYLWQPGWWLQHQRLARAMSAAARPAVMVSGDLHAVGSGIIRASGEENLAANPIHAILSGPVGTSRLGWPSSARGLAPTAASRINMDGAAPVEKNGFTLLDVDRHRITVRQFAWREPDPVAAIASLQPFETFQIRRG
jgi:hypothetical protein